MFFRIQQLKQLCFFRVIRAGGIAWSWANTGILLANQRLGIQVFVAIIAPELFADAQMHVLCKSFSKAICQRFNHDAVVVVTRFLIFLGEFFSTNTGGNNKATDVILFAGFFGCNEISKGIIRFIVTWFLLLLTNMMKRRDLFSLVVVHGDVIMIDTVRWPKPKYATGFD